MVLWLGKPIWVMESGTTVSSWVEACSDDSSFFDTLWNLKAVPKKGFVCVATAFYWIWETDFYVLVIELAILG